MGGEPRGNRLVEGDGSEFESGHERKLDGLELWSIGVVGGMQRVDDKVCVGICASAAGQADGFGSEDREARGRK